MNYTQYPEIKTYRNLDINLNTFCKLLCKPKNRVATKDKNNIVSEIEKSNYKAV